MSRTPPVSALAIVAPFFNEQDGAIEFHRRLCGVVDRLPLQCSFVYVDDGSGDATLRVLNEIANADPRVSVLGLSRNWGHQIALTAGIDYCDAAADAVLVMDSDLQHPPETIPEMIAAFEGGAEIVYGVRRADSDNRLLKRASSRGFYRLLSGSARIPVVAGAADFRLMSRRSVAVLKEMREVHRYLRGMVPWMGFSQASVVYDQASRIAGRPSYTFRRSLRLAQNALFSFSHLPLKAISIAGVGCSFLALVYLVYVVAVALSGRAVPGWSSVIAVVLIVSAVQFLSISILAQYLGMLFEQSKGRPLYVLKQARLGHLSRNPTAQP